MKSYNELDFTDDFVFCKVLENNQDLCKKLLEIILEKKITKIVYVHRQEPIDLNIAGRGVRLDVYIEDDENTVYDIEMQTTKFRDLPRRSRYYQGMIDVGLLKKGSSFKILNKSYIIFICIEQPFKGENRHKYVFHTYCDEDKRIQLEDGATKIFLTPKGNADDISEDLKVFLDYLICHIPQDDFTSRLEKAVLETLDTDIWRNEYMFLYQKFEEEKEEAKEEARKEGRAEGEHDGRIKAIACILRNGTKEDAVNLLNATGEEIAEAGMIR